MTNTPHAAAAAAARQRLASVLGTLQQDANAPSAVLEIVSGLARAMGPLFQLERGSPEVQLFAEARAVLQQTLERIQTVDQNYPGVADATGAIAQSLGIIFQAMRDAGIAGQPQQAVQPQSQPQPQQAPPAQARPPVAQPVPQAMPLVQPQPQAQPMPLTQSKPTPQPQPVSQVQPVPPSAPQAMPQPRSSVVSPQAAPPQAQAQAQRGSPSGTGPARSPSVSMKSPTGVATATVPLGPNGVPRLEGEIGVHSETNFYTDFLGDIHNHGGIFVATFHVLPIGSPCEVLITFPGNLTAEVRGVVRWKRESSNPGATMGPSPGLGIEITQANGEAWGLIERFMRKREPIMHEM